MGTSNWQNIPFCVEVLMKIEPKSVLDVGVGFGRWGMVAREFCEAWFGRLYRRDWVIRIEGIEAFADNIDHHHDNFYDKIHLGDAVEVLPRLLARDWDLVIFGDVIEHFPKEIGLKLLTMAVEKADYVLVNVPLGSGRPQREGCVNQYERLRSTWTSEDFQLPSLRRYAFFTDYVGGL
ncbi:MAG: class I SAM-dependent methyltransferase, partial [Desulfomonile sp.]|nr:class I SAM-dependent methyltransferase [Desulfomonile sp.]